MKSIKNYTGTAVISSFMSISNCWSWCRWQYGDDFNLRPKSVSCEERWVQVEQLDPFPFIALPGESESGNKGGKWKFVRWGFNDQVGLDDDKEEEDDDDAGDDKKPEDDGGPTDHPFAHHDNHKRRNQHTQGLDRILVKTIFNYFKPHVSIYPTK